MFQQKKIPSTKKHFSGTTTYTQIDYRYRLNIYSVPPTAEITLDQFERWAIDRLEVLGEIENCSFRNKTPEESKDIISAKLKKCLHLESNTSGSTDLDEQRRDEQRRRDHYSHFILRLAFARSEDLRRRFTKAETTLFKHRFDSDDGVERAKFIASLGLDWEPVSAEERSSLEKQLLAAGGKKRVEEGSFEEGYYKVDWERVPDLIERRQVFIRGGKAYVPSSLQASLIVAEFSNQLEKAMELTARALPRLDEDSRLIPILNHLSLGFIAPEYTSSTAPSLLSGEPITAASIDGLSVHFPACMLHLHGELRRNKHLKHFGRLQYTLFLKGVGLSVEEALIFWRTAFSNIPEDKFNKEYRYNVRHSYGLEGAGRKYPPRSCQQILLERPPGIGEAHGCPYRHFSYENLSKFLSVRMAVTDASVLREVKSNIEKTKFHIACNQVFEHIHSEELRREKERGTSSVALNDTIIHPNEYFERSWKLKHPEAPDVVGMERGGRVEIGITRGGDPMM
jgi:DNA primase large subunit